MANPKINLGKRIRILRKERGWRQEELADIVGSSYSHVSRIEAGEGNPSLMTMIKIAEAFGISLDELVKGIHQQNK